MNTMGQRRPLSVFSTVLALFLAVALLMGAALTAINYLETRRMALRVAADTFHATISRINEQRMAFFTPAFLLMSVLRNAPSLQSPESSIDAIRQLVVSSLKTSPQLSAAFVGYENGNFLHTLSIPESERVVAERLGAPPNTRFAVQQIRTDDNGLRTQTWQFFDADVRLIATLTNRSPSFDPRSRDWYRDGMARPSAIVRTQPYLFASTSQIGMTLAQALEHGGVVGVDIALDRLMLYIQSIRANEKHRFIAFDDKKRLIAHFDPQQLFKRSGNLDQSSSELATTADMTDPVVREALKLFDAKGAYQLADFGVGGTTYLATVDRQVTRDGGAFFQLYAAPLSDFQGSLADSAGRNLLATLLVFIFLLPAIIYLARMISKPLVSLSHEATLISAFDLADPIRMRSPVREVEALIRSMSGMKSTLREVSKFVPKALVKDILDSETKVVVGGATRRVSILFSDVKDFTPIAEQLSPDGLMVAMSEYFEQLASLIIRSGGTVDKYIGDAIFAFWNAPQAVSRHEHVACRAVLSCRTASERLNADWAAKGLPAWHTRFGVHVGDAVLGNVGSSDRIDYTAIGDTVNTASRLEGLNKFYGSRILASGQIAEVCSAEFLFRRIDRGKPKGVGRPIDICELLGAIDGDEFRCTPRQVKLVEDWDRVYEIYSSQDWTRTMDALKAFARVYPEDKLASLFIARVGGFLREPPPDGWDGAIQFDSK